ncbi:RsmB/NOP family class I SAM-dependent RNA methyltransferase [Methylobacterium nonmethylotrophicum]|uniref:Methyltransferase domain-containing protein n=1 Tax=Methylobacterium nonmethylotrophicum TaxID=1141884 RepID=A0A4Z0NXP5_9HYPH|nr:transcription antitermination factor NusB [Methylobacterium nonmethylotrophicum]TGE02620.1 methyltransferase domain-containing protein [Methylobacterium nonmethylotrophicum]
MDGQHDEVAGLPARRLAWETVADLLGKNRGTALEDAMEPAADRAALPPQDAGLARAIATTTFRHLGVIRHALHHRLARGLPEDQPGLVALLATGAAQILYLNVQDHAAVDLAVRLAKAEPGLQHLAGLANAVLRRIARERDAIRREGDAEPLRLNTPDWLARRWTAAYGEETARAIAAAHVRGAGLDLTLRPGAPLPEGLAGRHLPGGLSLRLDDARTPVPDLPGFADGAWWVQDAAAALPAHLLAVRTGERVADLCAAPGGKTAQLAAAGAQVLAVDRSAARLRRLEANLARLGLSAEVRAADALTLPEEYGFDAVLLDAPCSATGTVRRHPDVAWSKRESDLPRLTALQARLLDKAARLVRPGGRLVYCTCSLEPEEGEAQVAAFLARHPDFARRAVAPGEVGDAALVTAAGDLRTLPSHWPGEGGASPGERGGLDGFYAARLERRGA